MLCESLCNLLQVFVFLNYFYCQLFDILYLQFGCRNITPYIVKYGKHPVTGAPLKQEDLIPLTFHKNSEGFCLLPRFCVM